MLDRFSRHALAVPLDRLAASLDRPAITPDRLTITGLVVGIMSAVAAATELWWVALGLWLVSRLAVGVEGALARRRHAHTSDTGSTEAGGFLDITADFTVYGAFVLGVAIGTNGSMLPFLAVLLAYYVNGSAFLAFSSIAERTGKRLDDGRSLSFVGGLAEGTETIIVHSLWCLLPMWASQIAWVWAVVVAASATQRIVAGYHRLRSE